MHTLSIAKYQARFKLESLGWFYFFFIGFIVVMNVFIGVTDMNVRVNGFEMSSFVLFFVLGLNGFKNGFQVSLVSGTSRKKMFKGTLLSMGVVAVLMVIIDAILTPLIAKLSNEMTMFQMLYFQRYGSNEFSFQMMAESAVWRLATMIFVYLIGYFITVLYYRMNTQLKIIVSVGVPMLLVFVFPMILQAFPELHLVEFITKAIAMLSGVQTANPWMAVLTFACGSLVMVVLDYLIVRRVIAKDK